MACEINRFSKPLNAASAPFISSFSGSSVPDSIQPPVPQMNSEPLAHRSIALSPIGIDPDRDLMSSFLPNGLFDEPASEPSQASFHSASSSSFSSINSLEPIEQGALQSISVSPKDSQENIDVPEVTKAEFEHLSRLATYIRAERIQQRNWSACCFNIKEIWDRSSPELVQKTRACFLSTSLNAFEKRTNAIYGIYFDYHVVLLFRKDGEWRVLDPLMGTQVTLSDLIRQSRELKVPGVVSARLGLSELPRLPIQMPAAGWLLKVFDQNCIAQNLNNPRDLYKMKFMSKEELDSFTHLPFEKLYRDMQIDPLLYKQRGENMINLSQMIDLFQNIKSMAAVLKESSSKTAEEVAFAIDVPKITSYFNAGASAGAHPPSQKRRGKKG